MLEQILPSTPKLEETREGDFSDPELLAEHRKLNEGAIGANHLEVDARKAEAAKERERLELQGIVDGIIPAEFYSKSDEQK